MSSENMKMVPLLQDLCRVQAAVAFANHPDIKKEIFSRNMENCTFTKCESQLQSWNKAIQKRLSQILENIPYRLRAKIPLNLITLISIKMIEWARYHKKEFGLSFSFSKKFITTSLFTVKGSIDKEKAARVLVFDESLGLTLRYKIACSYFLADAIPSLYQQLSEEEKANFKTFESFTPLGEMTKFWDHYMRKKVKSLLKKGIKETSDSVNTYAYSIALRCRNDIAVLNCWKNLSVGVRKTVIRLLLDKIALRLVGPSAHHDCFFAFCEPYFDMLRHLFSHSDRELRSRLVSSDMSFAVLKCFLNWPNQGLFLEAVELTIETLPKLRYYNLLHEVVDRLENIYSDTYNYKFLLRELWKLGPQEYIRYVLGVREAGEHQAAPEAGEYDSLKKYGFLIKKLFELENFTSEDEEIVRLILSNATSDEKVKISLSQGKNICHSAIIVGNFDLADLLIECCLERQRVGDFKRSLISSLHGGFIFRKVMFEENFELAEKILNWALKQNEIEKFKSNAMSLIPIKSIKQYHRKDGNSSVNCIENFIKWATPSADIENCKKEYLLQSDFSDCYRYSIFCGEPMEIQQFLQWFFATEESIKTFKKDLAFKLLQLANEYFDISRGLRFVDAFVKWCNFTEEERNTFTRRFAYKDSVLKRCSEYAINHELNEIDGFITWTELPKEEVALFKRHLIFSFKKIHTTYSDLIIKGKQDEVDNFIGWSELSEHDVEQFKKLLALSQEELLHEYKNFILNGKFKDIEEILRRFPLSEEELKDFRKKIIVQNLSAMESLILEGEWDLIEDVLKWCFKSVKEVNRFKRENFLSRTSNGYNIYYLLTVGKKFQDCETYLSWLKIQSDHKKNDFIKQVIFNIKVFQSIAKLLVEEEDDKVIESSFKAFLHDFESLNRFRHAFLTWFAEQRVRNNCVNCGGTNLDMEHTYNLQRAPVFCYNVMRQTAKPHHMNRFKVLIDAGLCKLVVQKELSLSSFDSPGRSSGQGTAASSKGTSEAGLGTATSGNIASASAPAATASSSSGSASVPETTVSVKKSSKSEPAKSAPGKKTSESREATAAYGKRTCESEPGTTDSGKKTCKSRSGTTASGKKTCKSRPATTASCKKTCKSGPGTTASGKRKGNLDSETSKKRKL